MKYLLSTCYYAFISVVCWLERTDRNLPELCLINTDVTLRNLYKSNKATFDSYL